MEKIYNWIGATGSVGIGSDWDLDLDLDLDRKQFINWRGCWIMPDR